MGFGFVPGKSALREAVGCSFLPGLSLLSPRTAPPAAPFCRCPGGGPDLCTAVVPKYLLLALEVVVVILRLLRSSTNHLGRLPSSLGMLRAAFLGLRASLSLRVLLMSR